MKKIALLVAVFIVAAVGYVVAGPRDGAWYRSGDVQVEGVIYAGTSAVALTNAAGNLLTTAFASGDGNFTTLEASGATVLSSTLAVTGASTLGGITTYGGGAAITAGTTQTQAGGTVIAKEYNDVTVVANSSDCVTLPVAALGKHVYIKNDGANTLQIFPAVSGTIDGGSANASVTTPTLTSIEFWGMTATGWTTSQKLTVATGAGSYSTLAASSTLGITGLSTLTGGATIPGATGTMAFTGTTGQSIVTVPNNEAAALTVKDVAANSYLKFVTTTGSPAVQLPASTFLSFAGTTGQEVISIPTNLTAGLTIQDTAGSPVSLMLFKTTTGAPQVQIPASTVFAYTGGTGTNKEQCPTNLADGWDLKDDAGVGLIQAVTTTGSPQVKIPAGTLFTALGGLNETGTLAVTGAATVSTTLGVTGITTLTGGYNIGGPQSPTAGVTQTQAGATALTNNWATVTVGNANDGVILPAEAAGRVYTVCDTHATNAMKLYCVGACQVNAATNTVGIVVTAAQCVQCISDGTNEWCTKK